MNVRVLAKAIVLADANRLVLIPAHNNVPVLVDSNAPMVAEPLVETFVWKAVKKLASQVVKDLV